MGVVYMLNQCPANGWKIMSDNRLLHTLLHNASLHWCQGIAGLKVNGGLERIDRWMTAIEHLLSMGFPVFKELSYGWRCCSFEGYDAATRPRQQTVAQMGNSMVTIVAGLVLLYGMRFSKDIDENIKDTDRNRILHQHCHPHMGSLVEAPRGSLLEAEKWPNA